ncbi:MAG TPA: hypothetical protein EYI81_00710, partial [Gammaproteobacteria bacterium]|nr:hypothetical protein [Gammaproteobacteria bacterium]
EINLGTSAYIPNDYLPDISQRLIMYSRISSAISLKKLKDIQVEMINRFGLFPTELKSLFFETEIVLMAALQKIKEIRIGEQDIKISYLNADKDKTLKKGVDFEDSVKKIYKMLN